MKRHPVFAFLYERLARAAEPWEGQFREELCGPAAGLVLEIGAGTGANLRHYRFAARLVAAEPEPNMRRRARARLSEARVPVALVAAEAERLPFADRRFDTVVFSLTLCSVQDLRRAISECARVLRPGGSLRFYEHVRSDRAGIARWQDRMEGPWGFFAGGCHPNRDTPGALAAHGFEVRLRRFQPPVPGGSLMPHVIGEARLPAPHALHASSGRSQP
ncbi:class I SAM-dependent methyltransferase [soil metagenome]